VLGLRYIRILSYVLGWADSKVVYRRYASLFFVCGIGPSDNELVTLEIIHRYVEVLDRYFGNVSPFTQHASNLRFRNIFTGVRT
jgi:hypothetical protein